MMTLIPRDHLMAPIVEEFNKFYDQLFNPNSLQSIRSRARSGYPKLDVFETDEELRIEVAVPGVNPDDLKVELIPLEDKGNLGRRVLRLSGKMDYQFQTPEGAQFHYKELKRSHFTREQLLPEWASDDPEAVHEHGILTLRWSKPKELQKAQPKEISITKKA